MDKVTSIEDAANWFLTHASGTVIAVNSRGEEKECDCYPDAVEWINSEPV